MKRKLNGITMQRIIYFRNLIKGSPYVSLTIFVIIVIAVSVAGFARYQHVQAEIAAQSDIRHRLQREIDDWRDDISARMGDLKDSVQGTAQGAGKVIGGSWGIITYVVKAVLDFIGNLHIMIPVTVIYFGVGFFGTIKMRVATLLGAIIAFFVSTRLGIVPGSVVGLLVVAGLLLGDKLNPRLLSIVQEIPSWIKGKLERMRDNLEKRHSAVSASTDDQMDSSV